MEKSAIILLLAGFSVLEEVFGHHLPLNPYQEYSLYPPQYSRPYILLPELPRNLKSTLRSNETFEQFAPIEYPTPRCPYQNPELNRALVTKFYQMTWGDRNFAELDQFVSENYIEHSPEIGDGIDGLKEFLVNGTISNNPKMSIDFKRMAASGDLVFTHLKLPVDGKVFARVDIYRIECGKIAEHWDVAQEIDQLSLTNSSNSRPYF